MSKGLCGPVMRVDPRLITSQTKAVHLWAMTHYRVLKMLYSTYI